MKQFKKYLKLFIFAICSGYIFYKFSNSYFDVLSKVQLKIFEIFLLLFFTIIFFNIINLRAFLLTKFSVGYAYSYSDWSKLYFESMIVNSIIDFSGTVYRAIQLKKRNISYTKFIAISYLIFGSYISISLLFVLIELLFIKKIFFELNLILVVILIFFSFFFASNIFVRLIKFFFKFKILSKYLVSIIKLFEIIKKNFSKKKTIIILCLNTIVVHIFEIGLFYWVSTIFVDNINTETIILFFVVSFIIDRIPFFSEIPGASEVLLGSAGVYLGIIFIDGAFIKLSLRMLNYLSILINSGVYFLISYYDKNKFLEV